MYIRLILRTTQIVDVIVAGISGVLGYDIIGTAQFHFYVLIGLQEFILQLREGIQLLLTHFLYFVQLLHTAETVAFRVCGRDHADLLHPARIQIAHWAWNSRPLLLRNYNIWHHLHLSVTAYFHIFFRHMHRCQSRSWWKGIMKYWDTWRGLHNSHDTGSLCFNFPLRRSSIGIPVYELLQLSELHS